MGMRVKIIVLGILVLMFGLEFSSSLQESQTWDEAVHLSAGVSYWRTGDFRLNPEHPPLLKLLAGLPVALTGVSLPLSDPSWQAIDAWKFGELFLYENVLSPQAILLLGRIPTMLCSLLLGWLIFKETRRLFGDLAGIVALSLFAFDPNILAHSRYVTTDLGFGLLSFWTLVRLNRLFEVPTRRNAVWFGIAVLTAGLSKFSGMAWLVVLMIIGLLLKVHSPKHPVVQFRTVSRFVLAALPIAWLLTWAVYGFDFRSPETDPRVAKLASEREYVLATVPREEMPPLQRFAVDVLGDPTRGVGAWLEEFRHGTYPTYTFFRGAMAVISHSTGGHSSYLLGMYGDRGWWYYFPVAFLAKTPPVTLVAFAGIILLGLMSVQRIRRRTRRWIDTYRRINARWIIYLFAPALFMTISMTSSLNLGWRHILPVYPPLFVMAGALVAVSLRALSDPLRRILPTVLISGALIAGLTSFPNFLGYFSPFVGGNRRGPEILQDSNLDWGQDLPKLANYVRQENLTSIPFAYYGVARIASFVPEAEPLPTIDEIVANGRPVGPVAISVGALYDRSGRYRWLWTEQPSRRIGSSIYIYNLER